MKKFLLFLTAFAFLASTALYAAPARNTKSSGTKTTKSVSTKKATAKKGAKKTTKKAAAKRQMGPAVSKLTGVQDDANKARGKDQQLGLMPSEVDYLNRNVFHADAAAIRGARETEQALRYLPFVTIINTAGFGPAFDLRGQGRLSTQGVRMYINGVPVNPVDSYNTPMPVNTVIPNIIQEIQVFPGSGAILHGAGTKGGTIDVITSKRGNPFFVVGGGYINTTASKGNSFNAFAQAVEKFGKNVSVNAGLGASVLGGPRTDDLSINGEVALGMEVKFGLGNAISFDADVFYNKTQSTPYNSLMDFENINTFMLSELSLPDGSITGQTAAQNHFEQNRYRCLAGQDTCAFGVNDYEPDDGDRSTPGYGTIDTTQLRATASVNYFSQLAQRLEFNVTGFGNFNSKKYNKYTMNLPYFVLGFVNPADPTQRGYNWFLPRPTHPWRTGAMAIPARFVNANFTIDQASADFAIGEDGPIFGGELGDGERADWHFFDQSGSTFNDYKFGVKARFDWRHQNGLFLLGFDAYYEMSKKNSKSYLRQAIIDGGAFGGVPGYNNTIVDTAIRYGNLGFNTLRANIIDKADINVLTTGVYFLERYDFNKNFSVGLGGRYEMKNYDVKMKDTFEGSKLRFTDTADSWCKGGAWTTENQQCDFVNYNSGTIMPTTDKNGVANPDGIATAEVNSEPFKQNYDNFTFELAPVYRYSTTGSVYARGEYGYTAPPAWAMLRRIGVVWGAATQRDVWSQFAGTSANNQATPYGKTLDFDFAFVPTDLKSETYYTAELGWKEAIGKRIVPLGFMDVDITGLLFSLSVFYTASQNEFYFEGDQWSGMTFGNYKQSRRIGAELALEQYLFDSAIGFTESFTYIKADKKDEDDEKFSPIPYTYDWKATLGISVDVGGYLEIIDVGLAVWLQNSIYGNQNIYAQRIQVLDTDTAIAMSGGTISRLEGTTTTIGNNRTTQATQEPYFLPQKESKKLAPYFISDFGVSVDINKGMGTVTVGVKNLFNTFYYDYYNNDRTAVVNENRYVIGRGRTVFLEGTFKY